MNIQQIKDDVDFACGSTSATYSDTNKLRNINNAYQDVSRLIWDSNSTWAFDDSNNTDESIATRSMGSASANYAIPTTANKILGVEVKDNLGTLWKLKPISYHDLNTSVSQYRSGTGLPVEYMLQGNEITLFPAPDATSTTLASGMVLRIARSVTEFAASATTTEPGFASPFHRLLTYAAAIDFTQDNVQRQFLIQQRDRLEKGLINFYAKRSDDLKTRISPAGKRKWQQYL